MVENGHVKIYIISEEQGVTKAEMTVKLVGFDGKVFVDQVLNVNIPGNSSAIYLDTLQSALLSGLDPKEMLLLATVKGGGFKECQVKNILYFVPPKDLNLPVPVIEKRIIETPGGYTIRLSCDKLAKNLWLSTRIEGDFSDNYFDLLPGEPVEIQFTTSKRNSKMADLIVVKSLIDTY